MKKNLLILPLILLTTACTTEDPTPTPKPKNEGFEIRIHEEQLSAWSVLLDILPEKSDVTYYYDIISKQRWEASDPARLQAEIAESIQELAEMTQTSYEETLQGMLFQGEQLNIYSGSGFRGGIEYYVYAFYWDENGPSEAITLHPFTTPMPGTSTESIDVNFTELTPYSMEVNCTPTSGVTDYYLIFDETSNVEAMLAQLEDEYAFLSYQAMNLGLHYTTPQNFKQQGLKPNTSYTTLIMAIDEQGERFSTQFEQSTPATEEQVRVESELFTTLLGEWSGVQTINDLYSGASESHFNVTIVSNVEASELDYRAQNQLVALVDGWNNVKYYGINELEQEYTEVEDAPDPKEAFGPKWILQISGGDQITIDGQARHTVIGWMFMGDCYMVNAEGDNSMIYTNYDLTVTLSEDGNTLTISSPNELATAFPSLAYQFPGVGWMNHTCGGSDIVLTRK